jgi:hypothetical protein
MRWSFIDCFESATRQALGIFLLMLISGCAGARISDSTGSCRFEGPLEATIPSGTGSEAAVGTYLKIEGMVYFGYHESGFIAEEYGGESVALYQKVDAYCIEVNEGCWPTIERAKERYWKVNRAGDPLFAFTGVARILPHEVRKDAIGQNSCSSGNLQIVAINKMKPIRRTE